MRWLATGIKAASALLVAQVAAAQVLPIPAGARVRLTAPEVFPGQRVGRLVEVGADTVRVGSADGGSTAFAIASVERLEVSRGMRSPLWTKTAAIWLVPASVVSATVMGVMGVGSGAWSDSDDLLAWSLGVGTAVGIGASIALYKSSRREEWSRAELAGMRVAPVAGSTGISTDSRAPVVTSRVRLRLRIEGGKPVDGTFVEQRGDTIVLSKNAVRTNVLASSVTSIQMSRGKDDRAGAKVGALWGLGVGAAAGALLAAGPNSENEISDPECREDGATICQRDSDLTTALVTVALSTGAGAAIGALIGKERWQPASLPGGAGSAPRLLITPRRDRLTVGVRASF